MLLKKQPHPKPKFSYAILHGQFCGEIFVHIENVGDDFHFISIPKNENRIVPKDKFQYALQENILEPVQQIPKGVWMVLKTQYEYNKAHPKPIPVQDTEELDDDE